MKKKLVFSLLLSSALFTSTIIPTYASPSTTPNEDLSKYATQDLNVSSESDVISTEVISKDVEKTATQTEEGIVETVTDTTVEDTIKVEATNEDGTKDKLEVDTETGEAVYNGKEFIFAEEGKFVPANSGDIGTFAVTGPPGGGSNGTYIGKTPYKYNIAMVSAVVAAQAIAKWTKLKYKDVLPIITYLLALDNTTSYHDVFQYRYPKKCTQYVYRNYTKFYTSASKTKIYKTKVSSYFFGSQPSPISCTPSA